MARHMMDSNENRYSLAGSQGVEVPGALSGTEILSHSSLHDTDDVYAQSCTLTRWQQEYDQVYPGEFKGNLAELFLDDIQLCHEYTNLTLMQSCQFLSDSLWIGIPESSCQTSYINAMPIETDNIALAIGGSEFELFTPEHFSITGVVISQRALEESRLVFDSTVLPGIKPRSRLNVSPLVKAEIFRQIKQLIEYTKQSQDVLSCQHTILMMKHQLLDGLFDLLDHRDDMSPVKQHRISNYRKLISSAREYVLEQTSEPVSVADLCREFLVSRRTLQNIFTHVFGIGPNAWLKMVRLNAVRRELLDPAAESQTVKNAAMNWGFWHLSQFAIDYQHFFKERPSMTLQMRGKVKHLVRDPR